MDAHEGEMESRAKWYVLQVMSGMEDRVKKSLEIRNQQDLAEGKETGILEIRVPVEVVKEHRQGKIVERERKLYPGYVLVRCNLYSDESGHKLRPGTWDFIKDMRGAIGLIGGEHPVPLSDTEVEDMMPSVAENGEKVVPKTPPMPGVGSRVKVISGPFEGFEGSVESVDPVRLRLTVSVSIFGRSTPVEVESWQVETPEE